jgi:hypothetical protein
MGSIDGWGAGACGFLGVGRRVGWTDLSGRGIFYPDAGWEERAVGTGWGVSEKEWCLPLTIGGWRNAVSLL